MLTPPIRLLHVLMQLCDVLLHTFDGSEAAVVVVAGEQLHTHRLPLHIIQNKLLQVLRLHYRLQYTQSSKATSTTMIMSASMLDCLTVIVWLPSIYIILGKS